MRTEHIFDKIEKYSEKIGKKLEGIEARLKTLTGDCIILAASVVYLGPFSPSERNQLRQKFVDYITKV